MNTLIQRWLSCQRCDDPPSPPHALPLAAEQGAFSVTRRLTCQSAEQHRQAQEAGAAPLTQFHIGRRGEAPHEAHNPLSCRFNMYSNMTYEICHINMKGRAEGGAPLFVLEQNNVRFDDWKMGDQLKPKCPAGDFTTCATSGNTSKNMQYSKLHQGEQTSLIVALNLLQHDKYLSEISAVFELDHKSIFTLVQLAIQRFLLPSWSTDK